MLSLVPQSGQPCPQMNSPTVWVCYGSTISRWSRKLRWWTLAALFGSPAAALVCTADAAPWPVKDADLEPKNMLFFLVFNFAGSGYVPSKMDIYGHIMKYWVCILLDISWQYAHVFRCFLIFRELKTTLLGVGIERPSAMEVFSPKHLTHLAYQTFVNINWHRDHRDSSWIFVWDLTEQMHIIDSSGTWTRCCQHLVFFWSIDLLLRHYLDSGISYWWNDAAGSRCLWEIFRIQQMEVLYHK